MQVSKEVLKVKDKNSDREVTITATAQNNKPIMSITGKGFKAKDFQNGNNPFKFISNDKDKR